MKKIDINVTSFYQHQTNGSLPNEILFIVLFKAEKTLIFNFKFRCM
jgi:hypothetical protein